MRHAGKLTDWHDDKGYGFVVPNGGGERAFVHIKAFERAARRPEIGDIVSYEARRDDKGRLAAARVRFAGQTATTPGTTTRGKPFPRHVLGLLAMAALGVAAWVGKLPMPALMLYGFMSIVSFALYRADKRTANEGGWRTPENTLHAVDLLGGWPGGLLAQGVFRHKTRKASFQVGFWMAVIANCGVMGWLLRTA